MARYPKNVYRAIKGDRIGVCGLDEKKKMIILQDMMKVISNADSITKQKHLGDAHH